MAGSGAITKYLPPGSYALERDEMRAKEGQLKAPHVTWITQDLLSEKTLRNLLARDFDYIIANPDFGMAIVALALAECVIKPKGQVWMLLPSDYWNTSPKRDSWLRGQNMHIVHEHKLGRHCYRKGLTTPKKTPDSLFVFMRKKQAVGDQYTYPTTRVSLQE